MTEGDYRAGIVGLGFIGAGDQVSGDRLGQNVSDLDGFHLQALQNHPAIDVVAGSSRDDGRRERFAARTRANTYADWREMLTKEPLDVVSVATYAGPHADITVACAEAGVKAVYCEKPMATSVADCDRMIDACKTSGTLLVINHNRRFHPLYRRIAEFIKEGWLGDLITAHVNWGTGRLGNVGTHFFDALQMVTGRNVLEVSATLDLAGKPDCRGDEFRDHGGWGMFRMEGGLIALFEAPDYSKSPAYIGINAGEGQATIDGSGVSITWWNGKKETWTVPERNETSMDRAVAEIVDALQHGKPLYCDAGQSLRTLETIAACHISHERQSQFIKLPLTGDDRMRVLNIA
ncbi:MAG: Gfo/Idh/MocA family oxidoreductase [Planctomycetaceae bacterium]